MLIKISVAWSIVTCALSALSFCSSFRTITLISRHKLKNIKLFVLQLSNVVSQSIIFCLFAQYYLGSKDQYNVVLLGNASAALTTTSVFLIVLIDFDLLTVFAVFDPSITPNRVIYGKRGATCLFVIMAVPSFFFIIPWVAETVDYQYYLAIIVSSLTFNFLMVIYGIANN